MITKPASIIDKKRYQTISYKFFFITTCLRYVVLYIVSKCPRGFGCILLENCLLAAFSFLRFFFFFFFFKFLGSN